MTKQTLPVAQINIALKMLRFMDIETDGKFDTLYPGAKQRICKGLCVGFSTTYSYMAATGKLEWWQALLQAVSAWDGEEESLKNSMRLPGGKNVDETLRAGLRRVVNYVLYNQATSDATSFTELAFPGNQPEFLRPIIKNPSTSTSSETDTDIDVNMYFDSASGKITQHVVAAGALSDAMLKKLFDTPQFFSQEAIYMITCAYHACSIRYSMEKQKWFFYDPRYPGGEVEYDSLRELISGKYTLKLLLDGQEMPGENQMAKNTLYLRVKEEQLFYACIAPNGEIVKERPLNNTPQSRPYNPDLKNVTLGTLDRDRILEVVSTHGHTPAAIRSSLEGPLGIGIASWLPTVDLKKISNFYSELTRQEQVLLLKDAGIHVIAKYSPDYLATLITLAKTDPEIEKAISKGLLTHEILFYYTGLMRIAEHAPQSIMTLLELAKQKRDIRDSFMQALMETRSNNEYFGFLAITDYVPNAVTTLIDWAKEDQQIKTVLLRVICQQKNDGWSGFNSMAIYNQAGFDAFIEWAKTDSSVQQCFLTALFNTNPDKSTSLANFIRYASKDNINKVLNLVATLAQNDETIGTTFIKMLCTKFNASHTGLDVFIKKTPEYMNKLIALVQTNPKGVEILLNTLFEKEDLNSVLKLLNPVAINELVKLTELYSRNLYSYSLLPQLKAYQLAQSRDAFFKPTASDSPEIPENLKNKNNK